MKIINSTGSLEWKIETHIINSLLKQLSSVQFIYFTNFMNTKKIHLQSKCTIQVERKKEKRQTVNYLQKSVNSKSTKWQERQISANPASTLGPSSTMMMELSNICFVLVFECGRPGLQSSTMPHQFIPAVVGGRGLNFQKRISCSSGTCFSTESVQNKMQISSYLRSSSKSARLGFTGAIEKAEKQRQWRDCEMKKLEKLYKLEVKDLSGKASHRQLVYSISRRN